MGLRGGEIAIEMYSPLARPEDYALQRLCSVAAVEAMVARSRAMVLASGHRGCRDAQQDAEAPFSATPDVLDAYPSDVHSEPERLVHG